MKWFDKPPSTGLFDISRKVVVMDSTEVVQALGALAHETRLAIYRTLVEQGPAGLPAGIIAERLGLPPSSLTFHVQHLHRAGLLTQRRVGRQLIYAADFSNMNGLIGFLTENCCGQGLAACLPQAPTSASGTPRKAAS
jgi:DNA-binding transcriptional ArsR family regulator